MTAVEAARDRLTAARQELEAAEHALHAAVRTALEQGEKATTIAEQLGVTRARVYQLRDGRR
jgi:hypothetical protein